MERARRHWRKLRRAKNCRGKHEQLAPSLFARLSTDNFVKTRCVREQAYRTAFVESAVSAEFLECARWSCAEDSARYNKLRLLLVSGVLFCATIMPARASTITVTNTNDNGPGSLRQALRDAHDGDRISFAVTG